jgi:predicted membrane-bound mannosyltransferase
VATASTNSRSGKSKRRPANVAPGNETGAGIAALTPADGDNTGGELSTRAWWLACAAVLFVAALVRLYQLELRPMHHDEGVNGFFLMNLMRTGIFNYDPSNYHGPTLYYFTLPLAKLAERFQMLDSWVVRLVPVIFGMATVWLTLSLRRYIGMVGALAAAALLALSPGFVFFSRYFIHEMMFVFFTLGLVVAALRLYETGGRTEASQANRDASHANPETSPTNSLLEVFIIVVALPAIVQYGFSITLFVLNLSGLFSKSPDPAPALNLPRSVVVFGLVALVLLVALYERSRATYLILGTVSAALLFATKETAFISVGVLLIAWALTWGYASIAARQGWFGARETAGTRARRRQGAKASGTAAGDTKLRGLLERLGGWRRVSILSVAAFGIFFSVNILFYSSFFKNPKGVGDSLKAFDIWTKTGKSEFHAKPVYMYFQWLLQEESPLLALAALGALIALWRARRNRFALFAALWGFGLLAAYSLINYKTPWLALSMIVPFALVGGYAINSIYRAVETPGLWRVVSLALFGFALFTAFELFAVVTQAKALEPYVLVKYETLWPWVGLTMLFACLGGYALSRSYKTSETGGEGRAFALVALALALGVCVWQAYQVNLVHYDEDAYIYVYAHTKRTYVDLINEVERIAARDGKFETPIAVAAPEYWPMPWYLRNYKNAGYLGRVPATANEAVIIASKAQNAEVQAKHGTRYLLVKDYEMRPGVILTLYIRRDLAGR